MATSLLVLAGLLLVLAVAGGFLRRFGQSAVPVYILLGVATPAAVESEVVHFVQVIGIALLLFFVGLEFSILRLRRGARRYLTAGAIDALVNFPVGLIGGLLLGWSVAASVLLGAALYISSSAILARNISDFGRAGWPDTEVALGIIVVEDVVIGLFLAGIALWPVFAVEGVSPAVTLGAIVALGLILTVLSGPLCTAFDRVLAHQDDEILLLGITGVILLFAGGTMYAGLSEAVGAFAAGLLLGDTSLERRIETVLSPFRGLFAALFFFAFGLTIEAATLPPALVTGLWLSAAALASKLLAGAWIGAMVGLAPASRLNLGFTLIPRGEFSVLLAAYGTTLANPDLAPAVAVVVVVLSVVGTLLTQAGPAISQNLVRRWRALRSPEPSPE